MSTATVVLITLIGYKLLLIAVGLWATAKNRTETDFFLGGRGLGPFVAGLSYAASTSSAWVLLGFSGFVYAVGISAIWMVPGIWAGYAVVWLYFGPRLRAQSERHAQLTPTDFLLQDASGPWRGAAAAVAGLLIVVCFVFYIAAQFDAAGTALATHFAISVPEAVLTGALIVLVYSLLGGFWAVSVTDTIQALVMVLVALLVPVAAVQTAGGFDAIWQTLAASMPADYLAVTGGHATLVFVGFVVGVVGMSLGALGQPQLLNRLMAVRGELERRQGFLVAIGWGILIFSGMTCLGLAGRALIPELANGETLFYEAAERFLPTVLAGIVIAATLSAVMSTVDSILLAAAAAVAHDMGIRERWPLQGLLLSRLVMTAIAIIAVVLTLSLPDTIFNRVLFAWSALGAAFGPIVWWRVRGRVVNGRTALLAMLAGFATTVLFYSLGTVPMQAGSSLLVQLAHLPGDPFERVMPWVPALLVLWQGAPAQR